MPFQSEKQRRFLHANHPEIAKRWEKEYANGGISNHFRRKFDKGSDYGQFERRQAHNVAAGSQAMNVGGGGDGGGGGGGPKPHSGPSFAEIEAQKKAAAAAALEKKNLAAWEHSQTLKQNKKERIKKTKYLKGLLKKDPLYDTYVDKGLLDWENIKTYDDDIKENVINNPKIKNKADALVDLLKFQSGAWGYTTPFNDPRPWVKQDDSLYIDEVDKFDPTWTPGWTGESEQEELNKRIAETIGHEARHQVLGEDMNAPYESVLTNEEKNKIKDLVASGAITKTEGDNLITTLGHSWAGDPYSQKVEKNLADSGVWKNYLSQSDPNPLKFKGTHELVNTMGDFQAYHDPTIYNDIYRTIHGGMPRHLSSPVADQLYDASTQFTKDTKARHEGQKYENIDPVMVEGLKRAYPQEDVEQHLKEMSTGEAMDLLQEEYKEKYPYAKGGVARKNYYHGGILDINASEEIISDDGNDIELTDYNAAFDDPKDLSTGVKTLFQAKDGGRIGYAEGWSPGVAAEEKAQERASRGPRDDPDRFGPVQTVSQPTGDGYQDRIIEVQERTRKQDLKDLVATGPGSDEEKYDTDLVGMSDAEKYSARRNMIKSKYTGKSDPRVQSLKSNYQTEKARLEKKLNKSLFLKGLMLFMGMPVGITDFVSVDWKNKSLKGPLKTAMTLDQLKKQHIEDLTSIKESFLAGVDINNPNEMANLDNTVFPDIMKELTDLTKPRDKDEDTKGDGGPELPPQLGGPSTEEMATEYGMSDLDRIRAGQAKYAAYIEKIEREKLAREDNPIVGGTERNIIAIGNSGGLANLFRVKNQ